MINYYGWLVGCLEGGFMGVIFKPHIAGTL